jgi:hypothetical protein
VLLPAQLRTLSASVIGTGGRVKLLVNKGVVVGVAPLTTAAVPPAAAETAALRAQIESLSARIAHLETGGGR